MPLGSGSKLGAYEIRGPLGSGGMGEVYLAHDPRLDRQVAIKLLPSHLSGDALARERLRREAMAAAALDHPSICKIFEIAEDQGALFFAMEYVRGRTLHNVLHTERLPRAEALRIAVEIADAIQEAHAQGFVHRDLKPANIMLTPQGRVKVMDFGLAKRVTEPVPETAAIDILEPMLTEPGLIVGTPDYMAPEQVTGAPADRRADLFAFGVILWEMLTGQHPFRRGSQSDTLRAVLMDPPSLQGSSYELTPELLLLLQRLLAKEPEQRYQEMRDVRTDLSRSETLSVPQPEPVAAGAPLLGRDSERAEIMRLVKMAVHGSGQLVLIGGDPGIGKTHLTRAICAEAAARGFLTVMGHCYEMEGAAPYIPFVEMLEYSARVIPRETFRQALGDAAPEVAKLMPELRRMFPDLPPPMELPPEQQRRFLFNAYREFIERSARLTPILAVFEDLQWADEPILLLLQHLAQTVGTMPMVMIGTYRDVSSSTAFTRMAESLVRQKQVVRITLGRFDASAVADMLRELSGQVAPAAVAREIFERTEGNPFFVEEVFRHLAGEGLLFDEKGAWREGLSADQLQVPEGVRLVIARRLERLGEDARRVLTTAAVVGRSFSLRLLEEVENGQPDSALDALEQAEQAHLVVPEQAARETRYRFVHELIRQTLAETLSLPRRQRLHARVAEAIERIYAASLDSQASVLAHHLYYAGPMARAEHACLWLTRAAKQASAATAYEDALISLDHALASLERESSTRAAELQAERATALRSLGRMQEAVLAYQQALSLFAAHGEHGRFAEITVQLALIYFWELHPEQAREAAKRALLLLGDEESPLSLLLWAVVAEAEAASGNAGKAAALLDEIRRKQAGMQYPPVLRAVLSLEGHIAYNLAKFDLGAEISRQASELFEAGGDTWGRLDTAWLPAYAAAFAGRRAESVALAQQLLPLAERVGHRACAWVARFPLIEDCVARGEMENAYRMARETADFGQRYQIGWSFVGEVVWANIARLLGRTDEAAECCRGILSRGMPQTSFSGYPLAALAVTMAQAGNPDALATLREAATFLPRAGVPASLGAWQALSLVIEGFATMKVTEEAARLQPVAEELLNIATAFTDVALMPRTAAGIAAACAHDWTRATEHYLAALEQTEHHRPGAAIARYWYAEMLRARGAADDPARALELLRESHSEFESLRMPLYARRAAEAQGIAIIDPPDDTIATAAPTRRSSTI